ncbi:hypothetical protein ZWY2020_056970 [Hordeum vulgare]|nr:hypothetical protein ZWY2020_056970 [Hordeum vulgare]
MDLSRFASQRPPGLQQIGAASFRGACSLRRPRHSGGGGGNLMVASALRGSTDLFYAVPAGRGSARLRLRGKVPPWCQGNDSLAYVNGPLEGTKGSSSSTAEAGDDAVGWGGTDRAGQGGPEERWPAGATTRWEAR